MCGVLAYWCCDKKAPGCCDVAGCICFSPPGRKCPDNNCTFITSVVMNIFILIGVSLTIAGGIQVGNGTPIESSVLLPAIILIGISGSYYCFNMIAHCCCKGGKIYDKYLESEQEKTRLLRV